jgi:CheY-like chemotaxis protein
VAQARFGEEAPAYVLEHASLDGHAVVPAFVFQHLKVDDVESEDRVQARIQNLDDVRFRDGSLQASDHFALQPGVLPLTVRPYPLGLHPLLYCARAVPFTQPKPLQPPPPEVAGALVLVVDDEQIWRSILEMDLRMLGYEVALATDAEDALRLAQERPCDLAIIDLMLPEPVDGRMLVNNLRNAGLSFPVIFYTAYPVPPPQHDPPQVVGYLSKAVDRADLYGLIPPSIIGGRHNRAQP